MSKQARLVAPVKVTVVESIIDQFVAQIRDGRLTPNEKLPSERELIQMLGVSRSSVREALQSLVAMGLVEIRQGKGAFVRDPLPQLDLNGNFDTYPRRLQQEMRRQLNEARLVLEQGIITLAAQKSDEPGKTHLRQILDNYWSSGGLAAEVVDWESHDQIHLTIAQAAGNQFLVQILRTLLDMVPDHLREIGARYGSPEEIDRRLEADRHIHMQLCEAIILGDAESARYWMQQHARQEQEIIDRFYNDQGLSELGEAR
jgi:GntR family transcriptional repressor for pyruvate dehydrogenase complex